MKKKTDKKDEIWIEDATEKNKALRQKYKVCRSYGGILFEHEFLLSKDDSLKLAQFILDTWPKGSK